MSLDYTFRYFTDLGIGPFVVTNTLAAFPTTVTNAEANSITLIDEPTSLGPNASATDGKKTISGFTNTAFTDVTNLSLTLMTGTKVFATCTMNLSPKLDGGNDPAVKVRITNGDATATYVVIRQDFDRNSQTTINISKVITGLTYGRNTFKVQWALVSRPVGSESIATEVVADESGRFLSVIPLN